MAWIIVGLGNPRPEYEGTRHNTGRMALEYFASQMKFCDWKEHAKSNAHVSSGMIGKTAVVCVAPDTFMNKSGAAVSKFVKNQKAAECMVIIYDDLDLPLGTIKLSFDRGSGGHKGVESIMKAVKTKKFTRVRVGVSPEIAGGKLRKPQAKTAVGGSPGQRPRGGKDVVDFILSKFKPAEMDELKKVLKKVSQALEAIIADGPERAMNRFN